MCARGRFSTFTVATALFSWEWRPIHVFSGATNARGHGGCMGFATTVLRRRPILLLIALLWLGFIYNCWHNGGESAQGTSLAPPSPALAHKGQNCTQAIYIGGRCTNGAGPASHQSLALPPQQFSLTRPRADNYVQKQCANRQLVLLLQSVHQEDGQVLRAVRQINGDVHGGGGQHTVAVPELDDGYAAVARARLDGVERQRRMEEQAAIALAEENRQGQSQERRQGRCQRHRKGQACPLLGGVGTRCYVAAAAACTACLDYTQLDNGNCGLLFGCAESLGGPYNGPPSLWWHFATRSACPAWGAGASNNERRHDSCTRQCRSNTRPAKRSTEFVRLAELSYRLMGELRQQSRRHPRQTDCRAVQGPPAVRRSRAEVVTAIDRGNGILGQIFRCATKSRLRLRHGGERESCYRAMGAGKCAMAQQQQRQRSLDHALSSAKRAADTAADNMGQNKRDTSRTPRRKDNAADAAEAVDSDAASKVPQ